MNIHKMIGELEEYFEGNRGFSLSPREIYAALTKLKEYSEYSETYTISRWCDYCLDYTDSIIMSNGKNTHCTCACCGHLKEKL